ncbi:MAG: flagellar hook-associated protein 2 [Bacillota bacterium]
MSNYYFGVNRVTGLASGIDTMQMVEDLMRVARRPLDKLLQNKQLLEWKRTDYRTINLALQNFRANYASSMRLEGTFSAKEATSSDTTKVTATAGGSAQTGTYSINVTQLAQVASDISSSALSLNAGDKIDPDETLESQKAKFATQWGATTTLQFSITTYDEDAIATTETFTVDTTTDSLNDVIADINAKSSTLGVTAFYESSTDKVVISTTKTGNYSTNEIEIADVADSFALGTLHLSATANGQNAVIDINGLTGIEKYENTFTLNNVTFNLLNTTGGSPVTVQVTLDTDTVYNTIESFVEAFNNLIDTINNELNETRYSDYPPLTDEQREELTEYEIEQWEEKARSGLLYNDSILRSVVYDLRRALTTPVDGLTTYDDIWDIGISTGYYYEGGKLKIDEAKLREAINTNPDAVMQLFTRYDASYTYEQKGLGRRLYDEINDAIDRLTDWAGYPSTFSLYDDSYLGDSIRDLDERIADTEDRLAKLEERYWRQFTVMEQVIAQFNSQSMWLTQQTSGG